MSKIEETTWISAYNAGKELVQSRDRVNWFPLDREPSVGDNYWYKEKGTKSYNPTDPFNGEVQDDTA